MDNEVSVQDITGEDSGEVARGVATGMRSEWDDNSARKYRKRACAYAVVVSSNDGAEQNNAVAERAQFKDNAGGIRRTAEKILGATSVGSRILLPDGRSSDRGNGERIYRKSERRKRRDIQNNGISFSLKEPYSATF